MAKPASYAALMAENAKLRKNCEVLETALGMMQQWFAQFFMDITTIVLADSEVMGKDTFGPVRLERINKAINAMYAEYNECLENQTESDYKREDIDRRLRQICGDKAVPWEERYEGWRIDNGA